MRSEYGFGVGTRRNAATPYGQKKAKSNVVSNGLTLVKNRFKNRLRAVIPLKNTGVLIGSIGYPVTFPKFLLVSVKFSFSLFFGLSIG